MKLVYNVHSTIADSVRTAPCGRCLSLPRSLPVVAFFHFFRLRMWATSQSMSLRCACIVTYARRNNVEDGKLNEASRFGKCVVAPPSDRRANEIQLHAAVNLSWTQRSCVHPNQRTKKLISFTLDSHSITLVSHVIGFTFVVCQCRTHRTPFSTKHTYSVYCITKCSAHCVSSLMEHLKFRIERTFWPFFFCKRLHFFFFIKCISI